MGARVENPYRLLPSVEEVLHAPESEALRARVPRDLLVGFVQRLLDGLRTEIAADGLGAEALAERLGDGELPRRLTELVEREERAGLVRAVNATGVVLNTGLGRAPLHPEVAEAMAEAARSYCVLEVDRESGARSRRDDRLSELVGRLLGVEGAIAVNNNAAAVVLALSAFASGRETILSRGELVEIGGSFRMPDVMERAGTRLVEVGTTNRTRIADYQRALRPETGLLLKVHRSNFRVEGFVEEAGLDELAHLGRDAGLPVVYDLGSGLLDEPPEPGTRPTSGDAPATQRLASVLTDEPRIEDAVASGVDVTTFSGDKLFGGPQAGLLVGSKRAIETLRKSPMYRALRLDKVALTGLERTLELLLSGRAAELPARRMLLADPGDLAARAQRLRAALAVLPGVRVECIDETSQPGSGSAPGVYLPGTALEVRMEGRSADALAAALRRSPQAVFCRIRRDAVLIDPRTLLEGDEARIVEAFVGLTSPPT